MESVAMLQVKHAEHEHADQTGPELEFSTGIDPDRGEQADQRGNRTERYRNGACEEVFEIGNGDQNARGASQQAKT